MENAAVVFLPENIQEEAAMLGLDDNMPIKYAEEILLDYRNTIMNAMTEAGWLVIDEALISRYAIKGKKG